MAAGADKDSISENVTLSSQSSNGSIYYEGSQPKRSTAWLRVSFERQSQTFLPMAIGRTPSCSASQEEARAVPGMSVSSSVFLTGPGYVPHYSLEKIVVEICYQEGGEDRPESPVRCEGANFEGLSHEETPVQRGGAQESREGQASPWKLGRAGKLSPRQFP